MRRTIVTLPALALALGLLAAPLAARHEPDVPWVQAIYDRAEAGDEVTQYRLGLWHFWALRRSRDYGEALYWFCRAAVQHLPAAQNHLGLMFLTGGGVVRDPVQAYLWYALAAANGSDAAATHRDRIARLHLTPAERGVARALVRRWRDAPGCPYPAQ